MVGLSKMRNEVLEIIVNSTTKPGGYDGYVRSTFHALRLTLKVLGHFATPQLYHTYDIGNILSSCASTILSTPRLALHVKTFAPFLTHKPPTSSRTFRGDEAWILEVQSSIVTCIAKTGIGDAQYQEEWFDQIFLPYKMDDEEP